MLVDAMVRDAPAARRRSLGADEVEFVQTAFERILPELRDVPTRDYIDRKLRESSADRPAGAALDLYRDGIACVQERCRRVHGRPFEALEIWHQLAMLAELEDPESPGDGARAFVLMLVNDAAEAYFDAFGHFERPPGQDPR